ncbi:unnamed protein product [Phytophthora lilii]|uniref:Protein fem-1 homolog B n=1 Tax=Phytophthora lilii TaxID=2077276 RepID=A0A9W6TIS5_9STRA|nr:unnamed protein product [Phytophthora lilii]
MSEGKVAVDTENALRRAVEEGQLEVVRYLVEQCGADVNATENGDTALMMAAEYGHIDVVRYLTEQCHADVNTTTKYGYTAIMQAAANGHLAIVRCLAESGADVNVTSDHGYTALIQAAGNGFLDTVRYLSGECCADVNAIDKYGETALMKAVGRGHFSILEYLATACDGDVNTKNVHGYTGLMMAASNGHLEIAQCLVECGAEVNFVNEDGWTALMVAAENGHSEVVQYLSQKDGVGIIAKNVLGESALQIAADRGHLEVQRILIPFVLPHSKQTNTKGIERGETVRSGFRPLESCFIPPSEIELIHFYEECNIGGEYRARWLDADFVVKLFIPDASKSVFEDEVHLWQRLRHPNVIKLYGACNAGPSLKLFVCEYSSKESLVEHVKMVNRRKIWKYLHEAALGLEYLHERRIIHGDLRCSNILIGKDDLGKLSNFELSESLERRCTMAQRIGSVRWQAPEVLAGNSPSLASDVYSLGMCVLEAMTGAVPWYNENEVWVEHIKNLWIPEHVVESRVDPYCPPGDTHDLVWSMCCHDPDKRSSLTSIAYELERLAFEESCSHVQPDPEPVDLSDYKWRKTEEIWIRVQTYLEESSSTRHCRAFEELKQVRKRLQNSKFCAALQERFTHF